jgi:hypothetical protein
MRFVDLYDDFDDDLGARLGRESADRIEAMRAANAARLERPRTPVVPDEAVPAPVEARVSRLDGIKAAVERLKSGDRTAKAELEALLNERETP